MIGGRGQVRVVIRKAIVVVRDGELQEGASAVGSVVFLLGNSVVMELEVGEVRGLMTGGTVTGVGICCSGGCRGKEDLQALQLGCPELIRLWVVLIGAVG